MSLHLVKSCFSVSSGNQAFDTLEFAATVAVDRDMTGQIALSNLDLSAGVALKPKVLEVFTESIIVEQGDCQGNRIPSLKAANTLGLCVFREKITCEEIKSRG